MSFICVTIIEIYHEEENSIRSFSESLKNSDILNTYDLYSLYRLSDIKLNYLFHNLNIGLDIDEISVLYSKFLNNYFNSVYKDVNNYILHELIEKIKSDGAIDDFKISTKFNIYIMIGKSYLRYLGRVHLDLKLKMDGLGIDLETISVAGVYPNILTDLNNRGLIREISKNNF